MPPITRPCLRLAAGLALGLAWPALACSQDVTDLPPLPGPPAAPASLPTDAPPVLVAPTWGPAPLDPVATTRKRPHFIVHKANSWHWRRLQRKALGYPEEYEPRPLGSALYDHGRSMVARGEAARMVLRRYDFVDGTDRLNTRGLDGLARLADALAFGSHPLLIEPTPEAPGLDEARRVSVLTALAASPLPIGPDRVIVARPGAGGLSGVNAQIVDANALDRAKDFGPPIPIDANGVNSPSGVTGK